MVSEVVTTDFKDSHRLHGFSQIGYYSSTTDCMDFQGEGLSMNYADLKDDVIDKLVNGI